MRTSFPLPTTLVLATGFCLEGCTAAAPPPPPMHSFMPVPGWDWLAGTMYCLTPLVTLAAIVLIITILLVLSRGKGPFKSRLASSSGLAAKEIVQERYARGEISRAEYRQLLEDLEA